MPSRQPLMQSESGGGLLLLRRSAPLTRRTVAYFCSGAHTCPTRNCISMRRKCSSGLFDGSVISSGLRRLASSQSSRDASRCHFLFLSIIKAELMAIRVNQVENADLPSKVLMWTKAFSSVSWITSSVSWLFLVIRCTIWNIRGRYRSHNSAYAQFPPFCAVATRNSSLAVFIGVAHEELGRE